MTDILCNWLNAEVKLQTSIDGDNFANVIASGYLIGQILQKYELFDDFDKLIDKNTSDAKLNNFLLLEPVLKLIGVSFNNEIAHDIMAAKQSVAINLMYQMFIVLERKKKSNLTGLSIKTMQAPATTKFQEMETSLFQEKFKRTTPRQSDLNLQQVIHKYKEHQFNMQLKAERERIMSAEGHKADTEKHRQNRLDRSNYLKNQMDEQKRKIEAAVVQIPKQPPNKTLQALERKKKERIKKESEKALKELDEFEIRKSMEVTRKSTKHEEGIEDLSREGSFSISETTLTGTLEEMGRNKTQFGTSGTSDLQQERQTTFGINDEIRFLQPRSNDEYIGRIRARLDGDKDARVAREKRRRKVLMNCLKSHFEQEEMERENMVALRLVRQSQMERRIAVQLLQIRNEKAVIKNNRMDREKQYQDRREKEFLAALDKEQEMLRQFRLENEDNLKAEMELYDSKKKLYKMAKYKKHYEVAEKIIYDLIEMSFNYSEFSIITEGNIPKKIIQDMKTSFIYGVPVKTEYSIISQRTKRTISTANKSNQASKSRPKSNKSSQDLEGETIPEDGVQEDVENEEQAQEKDPTEEEQLKIQIQDIEVNVPGPYSSETTREQFLQKMAVLDQEDFNQYIEKLGEWAYSTNKSETPINNVIFDWIIDRLALLATASDDDSKLPKLPTFPIKAAIVGKCFSGKSTVIDQLVKNNRCVSIIPQIVINEALEAFENEEEIEVKVPVIPDTLSDHGYTSDQKGDDEKTENLITDNILNSSTNEAPPTKSTEDSTVPLPTGDDTTVVKQDDEDDYEIHMEPSKRALLGQRIKNELVNGRPINDELLVEVILEYIQRIPEDNGWILDDFPSTYHQAKLFEKAATGTGLLDAPGTAKESGGAKSASNRSKKNTPVPPKESIFDAIILLDTPDADCLKRAMMCTEEAMVEVEQELQSNSETIQLANRSSKDVIANLQTSLSKFAEHFPKLSKFYSRINEKLVVTIDSSQQNSITQVYLSVENILDEIISRKKTPIVPVEITLPEEQPSSETVVLELPDDSLMKVDDMESKEVLTSKGGTPKRKSRKAGSRKGSKGSSRGSSAGSKSSAKKTPRDGSASKKSKSKSEKAPAASTKSKSPTSSKKSARPTSGKKKKGGGSKSSSRSRSGSGKGRKTKTPTTTAALEDKKDETNVPSVPPTPVPGDPDWVYVERPIEKDFSKVFYEFWLGLEEVYGENCKNVFHEIRVDREDMIRYIYTLKNSFRQFLDRPDSKQDYVDQFQKDFNELAPEWRQDPEVMQELHQQISELKMNLLEISQESHTSADTELQRVKESSWLNDKIGLVSNEYLNLIQHELDRYQDIIRLMKDYYGYILLSSSNKTGTKLDDFKPEFVRLPLLDIPTQIEEDKPITEEDMNNQEQEVGGGVTTATNQKQSSAKNTTASAKKTGKGGAAVVAPVANKETGGGQNTTNDGVEDEVEKLFQLEIPKIDYKTPSSQIMSTTIANIPVPAKAPAKADKSAPQATSLIKMLSNIKPDKKDKSATDRKDSETIPVDQDEKLLYDAAACCNVIINHILEYETLQLNQREELSDKSGAGQTGAAPEKGGGKGDKKGGGKGGKKSRTPTPKKGSKDKSGGSTDKKGRKSRSPSASSKKGGKKKSAGKKSSVSKERQIETPEREQTETPEEKENRQLLEKIKQEYLAALQIQTTIIKNNVEHVMLKGIECIHELKNKVESVYEVLSTWIGDKLVNEEKSIKEIENILRYHVETKQPVKEKIVFINNKFFLNPIKEPDESMMPTIEDVPIDEMKEDQFSMKHLQAIYQMFHTISDSNCELLARYDFIRIVSEILTLYDVDGFPDYIKQYRQQLPYHSAVTPSNNKTPPTPQQQDTASGIIILEQAATLLADEFSCDGVYVNWKRFLLAILCCFNNNETGRQSQVLSGGGDDDENNCNYLYWPSLSELMETLGRFKFVDQRKSGTVTKEQYEFVQLWFENDDQLNETDKNIKDIKQLLFDMFKQIDESEDPEQDSTNQIEFLNYEHLLIHFAILCTNNYHQGISNALSIITNQPIPVEMMEAKDPRNPSGIAATPNILEHDINIPITALYKILSLGHGNIKDIDEKDFSTVDLEDRETVREALLLKSLHTIYDSCEEQNNDGAALATSVGSSRSHEDNNDNIRVAKLRVLLRHEGLWEWFHTCHWFKFVQLKSIIQKSAEIYQSQFPPITSTSAE